MARDRWGSRIGIILATAGSAIGLGNIWKFPYITGENGGGAFVLVYLACICLIAMPLMVAEFMLGKKTQRSSVGAMKIAAGEKSPWQIIGFLGVLAAFLVMCFYSVVAGWTLHYLVLSITDGFASHTPEEVSQVFGNLYGDGRLNIFWHFVFMVLNAAVVMRGIRNGIEYWSKILMPALFIILIVLLGYGTTQSGFSEGVGFLFYPDWSKLTPQSILVALGHSFFTVGLATGILMAYASYIDTHEDVIKLTFQVGFLDTAVAMMACLIIFPIIFTHGFEPAAGPGLVFKTIPIIFSQIPGGGMLAVLFFLLLAFAAFTSSVSILEVPTSYLMDEWKLSRKKATLVAAISTFIVGIPCALSGSPGTFLNGWESFFGLNYFDTLDHVASNYVLPIGGMLLAIYVGFVMNRERCREYFIEGSEFGYLFRSWRIVVSFAAFMVFLVFLYNIGILKF